MIKNIELNEFTIREGKFSYKSVKQSTSAIQIATVPLLSFSRPPSSGVSILIYTTSLPSSLPYTQTVEGYVDTCPISLLQKSLGDGYKAEKVLFRGHFLINAARELATEHSMRWQQLSLRYFWVPIFLVRLQRTSPSLELPRSHFDHQDLHLICAQLVRGGIPSHNASPFVSCSLSLEFEPFITIRSSSSYSYSQPMPKTQLYNLGP